MKELRTQQVTLDGLPLIVDYEWDNGEVEVMEVYLSHMEILSIMDHTKISDIRRKLVNGEGKEVQREG